MWVVVVYLLPDSYWPFLLTFSIIWQVFVCLHLAYSNYKINPVVLGVPPELIANNYLNTVVPRPISDCSGIALAGLALTKPASYVLSLLVLVAHPQKQRLKALSGDLDFSLLEQIREDDLQNKLKTLKTIYAGFQSLYSCLRHSYSDLKNPQMEEIVSLFKPQPCQDMAGLVQ
jgi:hypothetical protein